MELWERLRYLELTGTGLAILTLGFVAALFVRRLLPPGREHRGRLSVILLGTGPIIHLMATGLKLAGAPTMSASLHLLNVVLVFLGIAGTLSMLVFDLALGRSRVPTIVRDLVQVSLFGGLVYLALTTGGLDPLSVVTTSAVVTAILGLALQNVIANTFAGLVLQVERTFTLGDWIQVGARVGRIAEIRWRSSSLVTREGDTALIPNLQLLTSEVLNLSRPSRARLGVVRVPFHHRHSPGEVRDAVLASLRELPGVRAEPAPTCHPADFTRDTVIYAITYQVEDLGQEAAVEGEVRARVWYAAERAGLEGPCPAPTRLSTRGELDPDALAELERRVAALGRVPLFAPLTEPERAGVARAMVRRRFAAREVVLRQGEAGDSLFIVDRGRVRVELDVSGRPRTIAELGPGDFFGEMSLLTGEPRRATCRAELETTCDEIDADSLRALLAARPALAEELAARLAAREAALADTRAASSSGPEPEEARAPVFQRVQRWFRLG